MTPPSSYAVDYVNKLENDNLAYERAKERRKTEEQANRRLRVIEGTKAKEESLSLKRAIAAIACMIILGALFVGSVFMNAAATSVKCEINTLTKENAALSADINVLQAKIASANSMINVEKNAVDNLGMVYPNSQEKIHIDASMEVSVDLVSIIKEKAYK